MPFLARPTRIRARHILARARVVPQARRLDRTPHKVPIVRTPVAEPPRERHRCTSPTLARCAHGTGLALYIVHTCPGPEPLPAHARANVEPRPAQERPHSSVWTRRARPVDGNHARRAHGVRVTRLGRLFHRVRPSLADRARQRDRQRRYPAHPKWTGADFHTPHRTRPRSPRQCRLVHHTPSHIHPHLDPHVQLLPPVLCRRNRRHTHRVHPVSRRWNARRRDPRQHNRRQRPHALVHHKIHTAVHHPLPKQIVRHNAPGTKRHARRRGRRKRVDKLDPHRRRRRHSPVPSSFHHLTLRVRVGPENNVVLLRLGRTKQSPPASNGCPRRPFKRGIGTQLERRAAQKHHPPIRGLGIPYHHIVAQRDNHVAVPRPSLDVGRRDLASIRGEDLCARGTNRATNPCRIATKHRVRHSIHNAARCRHHAQPSPGPHTRAVVHKRRVRPQRNRVQRSHHSHRTPVPALRHVPLKPAPLHHQARAHATHMDGSPAPAHRLQRFRHPACRVPHKRRVHHSHHRLRPHSQSPTTPPRLVVFKHRVFHIHAPLLHIHHRARPVDPRPKHSCPGVSHLPGHHPRQRQRRKLRANHQRSPPSSTHALHVQPDKLHHARLDHLKQRRQPKRRPTPNRSPPSLRPRHDSHAGTDLDGHRIGRTKQQLFSVLQHKRLSRRTGRDPRQSGRNTHHGGRQACTLGPAPIHSPAARQHRTPEVRLLPKDNSTPRARHKAQHVSNPIAVKRVHNQIVQIISVREQRQLEPTKTPRRIRHKQLCPVLSHHHQVRPSISRHIPQPHPSHKRHARAQRGRREGS